MSTTDHPVAKATLSCKHVVAVHDGIDVGDKTPCLKCPATKAGEAPQRTVKLVVVPDAVEPEGMSDEDVAAELDAEGVNPAPAAMANRMERYSAAKAAAERGDDKAVAEIMAQPIAAPADQPAKAKRGRKAGRVCFLNLSPVRVAALVAAGLPADRLEGKTVDLQRADVDMLLANLPAVCDADGPNKTAACRLADWLERHRSEA